MTQEEKTDLQRYHAKREADKRFSKWRKRATKRLPEISQRVFALRNVSYKGCGFHYSLEAQLGLCIYNLQNMNKIYDVGTQCSIEVSFTYLFKTVTRIEREIEVAKKFNIKIT